MVSLRQQTTGGSVMKKILLTLIGTLVLLVGCGGNDDLENFTETYNNRADTEEVAELLPEEFGEMEELEDEEWRELYESDKYTITAEYDNDTVIGYSIRIDSSEPFEDKEGEGYRASTLIARTLGLSVSDYASNFERALRNDIHTYSENSYEVRFVNIGWDSSIPTSISISFMQE